MNDKDKIQKALKYLYIHLGEAQGALYSYEDEAYRTVYENQKDLCNELIEILEDTPKAPLATNSTIIYRVAPNNK